jgi:transcriptional regulator with XRE-family HTH domain
VPSEKPTKRAPLGSAQRLAPEHLERVGAFVRRRRDELGLSQGEIARSLGYKSAMSVSNIEVGKESLAPARAYAWADILEVRRDAFYLFVMAERNTDPSKGSDERELLADEAELLALYRELPQDYRRQVWDLARELGTLARSERRKR